MIGIVHVPLMLGQQSPCVPESSATVLTVNASSSGTDVQHGMPPLLEELLRLDTLLEELDDIELTDEELTELEELLDVLDRLESELLDD